MGLTTQDVGVIYGTLVLVSNQDFRRYCHFQRWIRKMDVTHDFSHALTHYRIHFTISFSPRFRFLYLCNSNRGTVCGFGFAFHDVFNLCSRWRIKTSLLIATGFMALGMMLPNVERLYSRISGVWKFLYLGVFGNHSRIFYPRFLIFQPILKIRTRKTTSFFLTYSNMSLFQSFP
jgi:hypothetical protein